MGPSSLQKEADAFDFIGVDGEIAVLNRLGGGGQGFGGIAQGAGIGILIGAGETAEAGMIEEGDADGAFESFLQNSWLDSIMDSMDMNLGNSE